MTRYSRSVIPGRTADDSLDRKVFGERRPAAANDAEISAQRDAGPDFRLLGDEADGYRPPPEARRAPLILGGAFVIVLIFGAVVWNAYRGGVRPADAEIAPQIASVDSFKSKPAATFARPPMETSQPAVFDAIESGRAAASATAPAVPVVVEDAPVVTEVRPLAPVQTNTTESLTNPTPAPQNATQTATDATPEDTELAAPPPLNTPPAAPAAALAGGYKPAFTSGGAWLVQIAAPQSQEAAEQEWSRRAASWPELFQGAERVIARADVNGRTVYRVRAGAFATQAEADAFCAAIKGRGGDCFRAAR